jgi:LysM repeat protein
MPKLLLIPLALVLMGCAEIRTAPTPLATRTLLPRTESTATLTVEQGTTVLPIETIGPSPTPLTHVISEGNTLLSIAIRYGVELADLLLANPGVNPRLLIVGDSLNIPRSGAQGPVPSATPVPIELSAVACYETIPEGLTCLLTVSVSGESAVEGVVALVTLANSANQSLTTEAAYGPTNLVIPGQRLPLVAVFGPQAPQFTSASALAISALNASEEDQRYADLDLQVVATTISPDGQSAMATGRVGLLGENPDKPVGLRLVVLALGENNIPVGLSTWEAPEGGPSFDFDITVFSLGPPIEALEIISEAPYLP